MKRTIKIKVVVDAEDEECDKCDHYRFNNTLAIWQCKYFGALKYKPSYDHENPGDIVLRHLDCMMQEVD